MNYNIIQVNKLLNYILRFFLITRKDIICNKISTVEIPNIINPKRYIILFTSIVLNNYNFSDFITSTKDIF